MNKDIKNYKLCQRLLMYIHFGVCILGFSSIMQNVHVGYIIVMECIGNKVKNDYH